jgi:TetR/AcrR family transcriptional repressor of mexJK operon
VIRSTTQIKLERRRQPGRPKANAVATIDRAVIRVARELFVAKGYGATSMAEVAKTVQASKGTIYARFPSKADLFKAIIDEQIRHTGVGVRHHGPKPKTLQVLLRVYAEQALGDSLSPEIRQLNRLIFSEAERFPELAEAALERGHIGVRQVAAYIREYAEIEGIPCRRPEVAADWFLKLTKGWYSDLMLRPNPPSSLEIKTFVRQLLKFFMAGRETW